MPRPNANNPPFPPIAGFAIAVAILYFARELFIPFAFALLFSFLLSPLVKQLEGWRIPRIPSSILILAVASALISVMGWFVLVELMQIARSLPQYTDNVRRKVQVLEGESKSLSKIISSLEEIGQNAADAWGGTPQTSAIGPLPVRVVQDHSVTEVLRDYSGLVLKPLGAFGLTLVFTLFMLIDREGIRNRLLRLMGEGKLQATTKAMDDAGHRVSRYVLMQFAVNTGFGLIVSLGLYLIAGPNSSYLLWGVLGVFLRFVPYLGPVIAWMLPFVLTLAMSDGWAIPLSVTGLFVVTELIIGNFLEPMLYGVHTGLSAVAIVVSAVFWTVVWGPVGLVLATPMTVCLSVLGRHTPRLEFLNIVLGDEPVLTPDAIFYQRLLALDQQDALNVLENLGRGKPLIRIFDEIVIPALAMAERDRNTAQLDPKREDFILQSINEFVTELCEADAIPVANRPTRATRVFCIPAHGSADEICAGMCAHFLIQEGFPAIAFPVTESPGQLVQALGLQADDVVCISAAPPFSAGHARRMIGNIRESTPDPAVVVGLWGVGTITDPMAAARLERLQKSMSCKIASSLEDAIGQVRAVEAAVRT